MSGYNNGNGPNAGGRPFDVSDFQQGPPPGDEYGRPQPQRHGGGTPIDPSSAAQQQQGQHQRPPEGYYGMTPSPYAQYPPQQQTQGGPPGASPAVGMAGHMMTPHQSPFMLAGYGGVGDPYGVNRSLPGSAGGAGTPAVAGGRQRSNFNGPPPPPPMMAAVYGYGTGRPEQYHMPYVSYNPHAAAFQNRGDYNGGDGTFSSPHDPYGMQHSSGGLGGGGMPPQGSAGGSVGGPMGDESLQSMMSKDHHHHDNGNNNNDPTKTPRMFKKPMLQKVTSTIGKPKNTARIVVRDGTTIIEDGDQQWFTGCVRLGLDDDKYWLSELQVYLRSNFAEAFGATEEDIAAPMHGRNKPIALGQVGIRCMHCKNDNPAERGQQATSYPSMINGIYNSVQQMLRLHLDCCLSMPMDVRHKIEQLKTSCSSRGGRKQYWIDSAKRLGLVDTPHGIHFGRDPMGPLPPLTGPSVNSKEGRVKKNKPAKPPPPPQEEIQLSDELLKFDVPAPAQPVDNRPVVFPEDQTLITDYLYLTLKQMAPCVLMEADRVGCYKTRQVGFPGIACRHCVGQAGCGRYFPASEASLSQTTTSQTIMNHVRQCRRCPIEIREALEIMKRSKVGPDGKRSEKPKHGGRKVFFHRLWCRIQGLPIDDEGELKVSEKKRKPRKTSTSSPKKRRKMDSDEEGSGGSESDESTENGTQGGAQAPKTTPWVHGCVRMTKTDDSSWLSDMEVFARSDLIEVFSHRDEDDLHGYIGRKEPAEGQVGIRCVFCKFLEQSERPNGCVAFPDSLSTLHVKVTDMIRLHFPSCPVLPDDARATFRKFKGFDARVASDDSQQYWIDSARDIGLSNIPPKGNRDRGSWGVSFRRDPLEPSPADEFDLDQAKETESPEQRGLLVRDEDAEHCTHKVLLLMRQVRPCRFKRSDRRSNTRGREREIGFPGLCCMHCVGSSSQGRYFPISAKNLTDNVASNLSAHVSTCAHCPESIRASLAYLGHRSILQKADLKGSWKKDFFQKIWDRIHVETDWVSYDNEDDDDDDDDDDDNNDDDDNEDDDEEDDADDEEGGGDEEGDDAEGDEDNDEEGEGEDGEPGGQMDALLKAAAIWLTNQDAANDKGTRGKRKAVDAAVGETPSSNRSATEDHGSEHEDHDDSIRRSGRKRKATRV